MIVVYIHGASATSESFNYIREHISCSDLVINYDSRNGFEKNLENMVVQLSNVKEIFFVGHSLGGIYALHLAHHMPQQVLGAVTLSTPYGGAEVADYAKFFLPFSRLMKDIGPNSWVMKQANKIKIQHPWTNIVTVQGQSPFMLEPNDGVVTISSQRHHADMELIEIDYNHYEVVLSEQVVGLIKERMNYIQK
jgi:hypothetical protein